MAPALATDPGGGFPAGLRKRLSVDDLAGLLADPKKSLYVNRPLANAEQLLAWARSVGFKKTLPAGELHVTLAHSKEPVDWSLAATDASNEACRVDPGRGRVLERLGDEGAVVLRFEAPVLEQRWKQLKDVGAVWDFPSYKSHVTLTYDAGDIDLSAIVPYDGPLEFGRERFAEIDEDRFDKARAGLVGDEIKNQEIKVRDGLVAADPALTLALDRDSVREFDRDGRLRVARANISKAAVNPYKGHEIPDWEKLGLSPNSVYYLLRDPEELKKAAATFNGVQILQKHMPVNAEDHQPWDVVGSTGTECAFNDPHLQNSLSIWTRGAIDGIESDDKKELSAGYHYRADMTPGEFDGMRFDGVMRDIVGNHVALVKDGRAGRDVVVGDSREGIMDTKAQAKLINAIAHRTTSVLALHTYLKPRLAMDAKFPMAKVFEGVSGAKFKEQKPVIAKRIRDFAKDKLAKDASLDDVEKVLDMLDGHELNGGDESVSEAQHNAMAAAANGQSDLDIPQKVGEEFASNDEHSGLRDFLKGKGMSEDDIVAAIATLSKEGALDESPEEKKKREEEEAKKKATLDKAAKDAEMDKDKDKDKVTKPAMDAAIAAATDATAKRVKNEVRAEERAIRKAEQDVRPYVGELSLAFDSAEAVYRHALTMLNVPEAKTIHASALPTILGMQPKAGARPSEPALAMDTETVKATHGRFPGIERIGAA